MNIATVGTFRSPGGESNHTLPYNNGVSLHVGPVRVLGGHAEAEIVVFTSKVGARSTAPVADAAIASLPRRHHPLLGIGFANTCVAVATSLTPTT